jgi:dipeptidyl aminopeptidase/acylaminoacyl peptidase
MSTTEERQFITFDNAGERIFGIIHRPQHLDKVPAVLICHGFAGSKVGKNRIYVKIAQKLAELGILSLRFDFRGSGDSEGDIKDMTIEGEVSDALKALEILKNDKQVDTNRMGIMGNSLGGMIALKVAAESNLFKSISIWSTAFDSKQWHQKWHELGNPKLSQEERKKHMVFDHQPINENFMKQFYYLDLSEALQKIADIPMLLIYGAADTVLLPYHAESFIRSREKGPGEFESLCLPNTDHDYNNYEELSQAVDVVAAFFKRSL